MSQITQVTPTLTFVDGYWDDNRSWVDNYGFVLNIIYQNLPYTIEGDINQLKICKINGPKELTQEEKSSLVELLEKHEANEFITKCDPEPDEEEEEREW